MKILLIEDDHKISTALAQGLSQERFVVDTAFTGVEGFDLATDEQYDCIILDRLLPGMDGLTLCKNLRQQHIHTPILMLTAKAQIEDRVEGLEGGADDYLTKPFAFEELLARVKALIRRPVKIATTVLQVGSVTLNPDTFEVTRKGTSITLSAKEFALLEYFMRHPNQTLSKDQIIRHVWQYDTSILPNTVEAFVGYLRQKLEKDFPSLPKLFSTIRGFGYKMEEDK